MKDFASRASGSAVVTKESLAQVRAALVEDQRSKERAEALCSSDATRD